MALSSHFPLPKTLHYLKPSVRNLPKIRTLRDRFSSVTRWQGIEAPKETIEFSAALSFFSSKKWIKLIPKTIGNRKKRLCVRLRSGDKHHLKKSSDRKAQIRKASVPLTGLICAFRSEDFLRWCLSPSATSRTISFFLFPIVLVLIVFIVLFFVFCLFVCLCVLRLSSLRLSLWRLLSKSATRDPLHHPTSAEMAWCSHSGTSWPEPTTTSRQNTSTLLWPTILDTGSFKMLLTVRPSHISHTGSWHAGEVYYKLTHPKTTTATQDRLELRAELEDKVIPGLVVTLTIAPNPIISMAKTSLLGVLKGQATALSTRHINVTTDDGELDVNLVIVEQPSKGKLLLKGTDAGVVLRSVSYADVRSSSVLYMPNPHFSGNDTMKVYATNGFRNSSTVEINIIVYSQQIELISSGLSVVENDRVILDTQHLSGNEPPYHELSVCRQQTTTTWSSHKDHRWHARWHVHLVRSCIEANRLHPGWLWSTQRQLLVHGQRETLAVPASRVQLLVTGGQCTGQACGQHHSSQRWKATQSSVTDHTGLENLRPGSDQQWPFELHWWWCWLRLCTADVQGGERAFTWQTTQGNHPSGCISTSWRQPQQNVLPAHRLHSHEPERLDHLLGWRQQSWESCSEVY